MSAIFELEYRGLNLLDEICTVEIAMDRLQKVIHIHDTNQVVEPEYNFSIKQFQMSEGFYKMAKIFYNKKFLELQSQTEIQWINEIVWVFYGSKKSIFKYEEEAIIEIPKTQLLNEEQNLTHGLYTKYVLRVL